MRHRPQPLLPSGPHTFASVVCISQGVPIETVSKIMGHRNISTTQRYAKITQEKIDRDVTALSFNIEDKFTLQGIDSEPSHILKDVSRRKYRPSKRPMTKSEKRTIITDK
ncbi:tyrosine-type recombinase/integrase [Bacteroides fragilis]|nr:tyrosine-type recombinase/integrase [Bacteroides fragilis]